MHIQTANIWTVVSTIECLCERTEHLDIFLFFPPITQWCPISDGTVRFLCFKILLVKY